MAQIIYQYRIYCQTNSKFINVWSDTTPLTCSENNQHTIDQNATTIISQVNNQEISIKEETTPTGGNYKFDMFKINATKNTETTETFHFPYPINLLSATVNINSSNVGDTMNWTVSPNTTIGVTTMTYNTIAQWANQNYNLNDIIIYKGTNDFFKAYKCILATTSNQNPDNLTYWKNEEQVLHVQSHICNIIKIGYQITLTDGVNMRNMGPVTLIDKATNQIHVYGASDIDFAAGTFFQMTISFVDKVEFATPGQIEIGSSKIGASYLPANTKIHCKYNNKSMQEDKTLITYLQYLY